MEVIPYFYQGHGSSGHYSAALSPAPAKNIMLLRHAMLALTL